MTTSIQPEVTIQEFMAFLASLNIGMSVEGDKLKINAPKGIVTPDLQRQIAQRKSELMAALTVFSSVNRTALPPVTPLPGGTTASTMPLSLSQQRLWSVQQLVTGDGRALFNMYLAFQLTGDVHKHALLAGLNALVARHPALRTKVRLDNGDAHLDVRTAEEWQPDQVDLANQPDATFRFSALRQTLITRPFDLLKELPFRATLVDLPENCYGLVLTAHHIAADGWSWGVLLRELSTLYQAACQDADPHLPELPISYVDFAAWQHRMAAEGRFQEQTRWWEDTLHGSRTISLPTVPQSNTPANIYLGERISISLSDQDRQAVLMLGKQTRTTPFAILGAAFALTLRQLGNTPDMVFCIPLAGRDQPDLGGVVGYFNNLMPVRIHAAGEQSFVDTITHVQRMVSDIAAHQDVPFQHIAALPELQNLNLARAVFNLQDASGHSLKLAGAICTHIPCYTGVANFDLSLTIEDSDDVYSVIVEYRSSVLTQDTAQTVAQTFVDVLRTALDQPTSLIAALSHTAHLSVPTLVSPVVGKMRIQPSSETEHTLVKIWREVLGVQDIGVTDSFFALGGHSLQAIRLMTRVEAELNIALSQTAVFESPTIRALASVIQNNTQSKWRWLVPLQATGNRPPLMLVHHGAGGVFGYARIGQYLHPQQRLYGVQEPGWRKSEARPESIEQMARLYLAEVRTLQPHGPYALGGFCFGAIVAYEMAQQLQAEGEQVRLLALIDAFSPLMPELSDEKPVARHVGRLRELNGAQRVQYLAQRAQRRIRWEVHRSAEAARHRAWGAWYHFGKTLNLPLPGEVLGVQFMRWNSKLQAAYIPRPYTGKAILIRSQHPYPLRDFGWSQLIAGGVTVCDMPTEDHLGMLEEPNVRLLAAHLQAHLET